jgi:hypothetical protein
VLKNSAGEILKWGIFAVNGDSLEICERMPTSSGRFQRPTEFKTSFGGFENLKVLRRCPLDLPSSATRSEYERLIIQAFGPRIVDGPQHVGDQKARNAVETLYSNLVKSSSKESFHDFYSTLSSEKERVIVLTMKTIQECEDDGFYCFFSFPVGAHWQEIAACFDTIGARDTANMVREASKVFPNSTPSAADEARKSSLEQLDLTALDRLDELDRRFATRTEDLCKLALQFWQSH